MDLPSRHADGSWCRVLELGCGDGEITRELLCNGHVCDVTAVDARQWHLDQVAKIPETIHGPEKHPEWKRPNSAFASTLTLLKVDAEALKFELDRWEEFDLIVHVGLLYHLSDPQSHLRLLPRIAPRLLLDTHYSVRKEVHSERTDQLRAGLRPQSQWLTKEVILYTLNQGYDHIDLINDRLERNGLRLTIAAWHTRDR
jgi:SAM-dependent methyltransferase